MNPRNVLILPGWQGSGPDHWQSRWERLYGYTRVEQHDWMRPLRGDWIARLEEVVLGCDIERDGPAVLVAHSLGCPHVAAWAAHSKNTPYDRSVPAALALEAATGRKLARSSASQERLANAPFLALVDEFEPDVRFQYVDPVPWLCAQECRVIEESVSLYRDAHHLSVAGAMSIKAELSQAFARGGEPPRAVRVASP